MARLRLSLGALALVAWMNLSALGVSAGVEWCEEDPEFVVNGALVDVTTLFPAGYASYVTSAVNFDMQVPSNVTAAAVSLPGTIPVAAQIRHTLPAYYGIGTIPVVVTVSMSSSYSFQTYTQITGLGGSVLNSVYGTATSPTYAKFWMYGL